VLIGLELVGLISKAFVIFAPTKVDLLLTTKFPPMLTLVVKVAEVLPAPFGRNVVFVANPFVLSTKLFVSSTLVVTSPFFANRFVGV